MILAWASKISWIYTDSESVLFNFNSASTLPKQHFCPILVRAFLAYTKWDCEVPLQNSPQTDVNLCTSYFVKRNAKGSVSNLDVSNFWSTNFGYFLSARYIHSWWLSENFMSVHLNFTMHCFASPIFVEKNWWFNNNLLLENIPRGTQISGFW